jgi:hypothetical protein
MGRVCTILGSVRLTVYLLLLISANLTVASFYVKMYPTIYSSLNSALLPDWYELYGQNRPDKLWWLLTLFGLLIALGMNTGMCTFNRIAELAAKRRKFSLGSFAFRMIPSLIHVCFLMMLLGHLLTMISGFVLKAPLSELESLSPVPLKIIASHCDYFNSPEALIETVAQCTLSLRMEPGGEDRVKQLMFLDPFTYKGFTFHLSHNKKETREGLYVVVKRDYGLRLILTGFSVMVLLMLLYFRKLQFAAKGG